MEKAEGTQRTQRRRGARGESGRNTENAEKTRSARRMEKNGGDGMEITDRDRFWMNNKLYQLWRFIVLNLKILKAVDHSKRS